MNLMDDQDSTQITLENGFGANLQNKLLKQENQIDALKQNQLDLHRGHENLVTTIGKLSQGQTQLNATVQVQGKYIDQIMQQQKGFQQSLKDISQLVENVKIKKEELEIIRAHQNMLKYYSEFQATLSHCYCQSIVVKSRNVMLDGQNILINIGISLLALFPVIGYTLSTSTKFIYQTMEESQLISKAIIFTTLASSQSELDQLVEYVARKITLAKAEQIQTEQFDIDQELFTKWQEGFDLIVLQIAAGQYNLPQISKVEHLAHLEANYLASAFISDQNQLRSKYLGIFSCQERAELLASIIISREILQVDLKIQSKETTNCTCELPCLIY